MDRRQMLGSVAAGMASLGLVNSRLSAAEKDEADSP